MSQFSHVKLPFFNMGFFLVAIHYKVAWLLRWIAFFKFIKKITLHADVSNNTPDRAEGPTNKILESWADPLVLILQFL